MEVGWKWDGSGVGVGWERDGNGMGVDAGWDGYGMHEGTRIRRAGLVAVGPWWVVVMMLRGVRKMRCVGGIGAGVGVYLAVCRWCVCRKYSRTLRCVKTGKLLTFIKRFSSSSCDGTRSTASGDQTMGQWVATRVHTP